MVYHQFSSIYHHSNKEYTCLYFDRNNNLNCYVSFNFIEFLKTYSSFPEIYDDPAFSASDLLRFDFLLQSNNNKLTKATNVEQINLLNNSNILTFFINLDTCFIWSLSMILTFL